MRFGASCLRSSSTSGTPRDLDLLVVLALAVVVLAARLVHEIDDATRAGALVIQRELDLGRAIGHADVLDRALAIRLHALVALGMRLDADALPPELRLQGVGVRVRDAVGTGAAIDEEAVAHPAEDVVDDPAILAMRRVGIETHIFEGRGGSRHSAEKLLEGFCSCQRSRAADGAQKGNEGAGFAHRVHAQRQADGTRSAAGIVPPRWAPVQHRLVAAPFAAPVPWST